MRTLVKIAVRNLTRYRRRSLLTASLIAIGVVARDTSYLATAIVSPSHELSPGMDEKVRAQLAGVLSPMGDFSHSMTVRQLGTSQRFFAQ